MLWTLLWQVTSIQSKDEHPETSLQPVDSSTSSFAAGSFVQHPASSGAIKIEIRVTGEAADCVCVCTIWFLKIQQEHSAVRNHMITCRPHITVYTFAMYLKVLELSFAAGVFLFF